MVDNSSGEEDAGRSWQSYPALEYMHKGWRVQGRPSSWNLEDHYGNAKHGLAQAAGDGLLLYRLQETYRTLMFSDNDIRRNGLPLDAFRLIYPHPVEEYAVQIKRWKHNGNLLAAVSQDYMCEAVMLEKTGLTVADHQWLTIERYDGLLRCDTGVYI